jgi:hypothetical protein
VPPLAGRAYELSRVIDEYVRDAIIELNAQDTGVTDADRAWIRERAASSLAEIEKAALRMVAIRASRSVSAAAERIGMAPVSLLNWLGRRRRTDELGHPVPGRAPSGGPNRLRVGFRLGVQPRARMRSTLLQLWESRTLHEVDDDPSAVEHRGLQRDAADPLQVVADLVTAELEAALAMRRTGVDPNALRRALRRIEESRS